MWGKLYKPIQTFTNKHIKYYSYRTRVEYRLSYMYVINNYV